MIRPETDVTMLNRHGDAIHATITMPETQEPVAAVLLVHGFKGFRNWSFLPLMAQEAASRSIIGVRIDLTLNGMQARTTACRMWMHLHGIPSPERLTMSMIRYSS
jgi:hypothetical protein